MRIAALLVVALLLLAAPPVAAQAPPPPLTRIAFGSCANEEKPQPVWDAVLAYRPQLFLFAGDNVYGDVSAGRPVPAERAIEGLRESYALAADIPGLKTLREQVPHLATWDDHDYGLNDAGASFAGKREAQALFLDFWKVPADDPRRGREGVYHAQTFGPPGARVQVIMLDTRTFRSDLKITDQRGAPGRERYLPDDDPAKTMLGEAQWTWLAERLREPAELRLVLSSIQVLARGHGWESWANLPRERRRLIDLVSETKANGVVFLSGDRHIGALYEEREGTPYRLVEITSSGLTETFPGNREAGPNRLGAVYGDVHFGSLDIDWWAGSLALSLRSENGEVVRRERVEFRALRPPAP
jgi:alkaline phosphatase D